MDNARTSTVRCLLFRLTVSCAAVLVLTGPSAIAQRRGFVMSAPTQSHAVIRVAPRTETRVTASPASTNMHDRERGRTADYRNYRDYRNYECAYGGSVQQLLNPVPPYGFDYQYLNAIDSDLNLKAAIDPATQLALSEASRYACGGYGTGGYILWDGGGYIYPQGAEEQTAEPAGAPQPQVIVVQVPGTSQTAAIEPAIPPTEEEEEQAAPLPDEGQFVLVMRDGTRIKAAAFTRSSDTIIYISPDGLRHTIALSDLDTEATLRLNSERGSQLQLSL